MTSNAISAIRAEKEKYDQARLQDLHQKDGQSGQYS